MHPPRGFCLNSIKSKHKESFGLITAPSGMKAAGIFTTNKFPAYPVIFSKKSVKNTIHKAVLVNSGSANAATGIDGKKQVDEFLKRVSEKLNIKEKEMLFASTGIIGKRMNYTEKQIKDLIRNKNSKNIKGFSKAIMTTDTREKVVKKSFKINKKNVNILGIAKGSGMVAPDLATMLAFVLTDINIEKNVLEKSLKKVSDISFNCLTIDGEASTNDTVFLASTCKAENSIIKNTGRNYKLFFENLKSVCTDLTEKLAKDGEGATKFIRIKVKGAQDKNTAKGAAEAIANSPLCKTAFYGASPNWGRIICALGRVNTELKLEKINIKINEVEWIKKGKVKQHNKKHIKDIMSRKEYNLEVELNSGDKQYTAYTCDLTPEYVKINALYVT
ncbi:MAG: bifunctional glutamate N-acetyltransferase/amino-acid acetyltransferase ArgJ [Elusimicrobiota bacterium]